MLIRVGPETAETLTPMLEKQPELAVRASALLKAYGTERHFFNIWVQNDYGAVLTRLDSTFSLLDLGGIDYEETAFFLEFNPYFKRLAGELSAIRNTAAFFDRNYKLERINLMKLENFSPVKSAPFVTLVSQPELKEVFHIITDVMTQETNFTAWYTDLSHRIRHGGARAFLLRLGGESVSACLVSAESGSAGLISGLATQEDSRCCGFGSRILAGACEALRASGKTPVLECFDSLLPFYEKAGFAKIGDEGELDII